MEIILDLKKLEKSELCLKKFVYLQALVDEVEIDLDLIDPEWKELEEELEVEMYIKVVGRDVFPRQKTLDLFSIKQNDVTFDEFWDKYHSVTGKPKTDKNPAEKYWRKLTKTHKKLALDMIEPYYNSLDNPRFCKKARTYLADKNFLDEFVKENSGEDPFIQKA